MSVKLDVGNDPVTIRFAEAEPFAFIYRHLVDKIPHTCIGDDCPLCEVGDKPKPVVFYSVIDLTDSTMKVWELSADPTRTVQKHYDRLANQGNALNDPDVAFVVSKKHKEYDVEQFVGESKLA